VPRMKRPLRSEHYGPEAGDEWGDILSTGPDGGVAQDAAPEPETDATPAAEATEVHEGQATP